MVYFSRNLRFNHQSDKSPLVGKGADGTEKRSGGAGEPPIISHLPNEECLTREMYELYKNMIPTQESIDKRKDFAAKMEKLLNDEWPGHDIKVHMFGSSMNLLGTTQSDVDLCITTPWNGLKGVNHLSKCLKNRGMIITQCVPKAKVPIVRLWDPSLSLACDININNTLALHNTRLIQKYVEIDQRVRPLAMVVKHWARERVLNDAAKGGTISTYTWTCIVLNFLQMRNPPILPVLHNIPHNDVEPIIVNGEDASFYENVEALKDFGSKNKESIGGLLFAFFRCMAYEFDYDKYVISLRQGKYLTKVEKGWDTCRGWKMLCVEEPFNTARNLGNSADDISVEGLKGEFRRAYRILYDAANLASLCERYIFPYQHNNNHYNRGFKNGGSWKSGNRKYVKYYHQNGQQNSRTNSESGTIDNFQDMNGKNVTSQDVHYNEEDEYYSSGFVQADHIPSSRKNGYCPTIDSGEEFGIIPTSDVDAKRSNIYYNNNNTDVDRFSGQTRKQLVSSESNHQNKRECNSFPENFVPLTNTHNNSQVRHDAIPLDLKEDEQFPNYPLTRHVKNDNFNRPGPTKKKNEKRCCFSPQTRPTNIVNPDSETEGTSRSFSQNYNAYTTSNQNQFVYKHNNNQRADNKNSRSHGGSSLRISHPPRSERRSSFSQDMDPSYVSNNGYSNHSHAPGDSNHQKSFSTYNTNFSYDSDTKYNKPKQFEESSPNSINPLADDSFSNSNFNNNARINSGHKSQGSNNNNYNNTYNNNYSNKFGRKHTHSKSSEFTYPPDHSIPSPNNIYSDVNNGNGYSSPQTPVSLFTPPQQQFYHEQHNDGPADYQRRMSHQSSSDGSNSQTSGNTSNTSYSNSSDYPRNIHQKGNNNNQDHYYQQQNQNKQNNNNFYVKKRKQVENRNNDNTAYRNSVNGNNNVRSTVPNNYEPTSMSNNSDPISNPTPPHMNQGYQLMSKVDNYAYENSSNADTNGYRVHNGNHGSYNNNASKGYNSNNNSNGGRNSNGNNANFSKAPINNNHMNSPKSSNCFNQNSSSNRNGSNSNNNCSRSSNTNNHYYPKNPSNNTANSYNSYNKQTNGSGQNFQKPVDGNNNFSGQTRNGNNNHYLTSQKNGGNNNYNTSVQRNNQNNQNQNNNYIKKGRPNNNVSNNNKNPRKYNKEDGFNQQQLPSSYQERQNYNTNQSYQHNNNYQQEGGSSRQKTGQNINNSKKGNKGGTRKYIPFYNNKQNVECCQ